MQRRDGPQAVPIKPNRIMLKEFIDDLRRHGIAVFDLIQAGAGNHIFFARRNGHTWSIRISRQRGEHRYTVHIFSEESDIRGTYSCPPGLLLTTIELRFNDLATP